MVQSRSLELQQGIRDQAVVGNRYTSWRTGERLPRRADGAKQGGRARNADAFVSGSRKAKEKQAQLAIWLVCRPLAKVVAHKAWPLDLERVRFPAFRPLSVCLCSVDGDKRGRAPYHDQKSAMSQRVSTPALEPPTTQGAPAAARWLDATSDGLVFYRPWSIFGKHKVGARLMDRGLEARLLYDLHALSR